MNLTSKKIGIFEFSGYWHDIGSISELEIAKKGLKKLMFIAEVE